MSLEELKKVMLEAIKEEEKPKRTEQATVVSTVATVERIEKKKRKHKPRKPIAKILAKHNTSVEEIRFIYYLLKGETHRGRVEEAIEEIIWILSEIKKEIEQVRE